MNTFAYHPLPENIESLKLIDNTDDDFLGEDPFSHWFSDESFNQGSRPKDENDHEMDDFSLPKRERSTTLNTKNRSLTIVNQAENKIFSITGENNYQSKVDEIAQSEEVKDEVSKLEVLALEKLQPNTLNEKRTSCKSTKDRLDVVNKIFVRAVKRYYCDTLAGSKVNIQTTSIETTTECLHNIDLVSEEIFRKHFPDVDVSDTLSIDALLSAKCRRIHLIADPKIMPLYDIKVLLSSMLLRRLTKKYLMFKIVKTQFLCYYDVVYNYTHKKMLKLVNLPTFKILFQHFVSSGGLEKMLVQDETLKANCDLYKERAAKIMSLIT